LPLFMCQKG